MGGGGLFVLFVCVLARGGGVKSAIDGEIYREIFML